MEGTGEGVAGGEIHYNSQTGVTELLQTHVPGNLIC